MNAALTPRSDPRQSILLPVCPIAVAVESLAEAGMEERGAIFTRLEVVNFVLDLVGYTVDQPLQGLRLLEPACGEGAFLLPVVERLLAAWRVHGTDAGSPVELAPCIRAVESHRPTFQRMRQALMELLTARSLALEAATQLADAWLVQGDFLLVQLDGVFDLGVGNPPYVRSDCVPGVLMAAYRARYPTLFDRADLYVPFYERTLRLLGEGGRLGFICSDRWTKNRYGGPLRRLVADGGFHLRAYVDMVGTPAFLSEVVAYPAITIIAREAPGPTRVAVRPAIEAGVLARLSAELTGSEAPKGCDGVRVLSMVPDGDTPWMLEASDQVALVRRLEADFPTLEEAGCRVGIGVATGADEVFIAPYDALDVEDDRKLPLATTADILDGTVRWRGLGVVNPHADGPGLVRLEDHPRLRRYLERHRVRIAGRHCARKAPGQWYRTVDRIHPVLAHTPKLLIPDIKGKAHIVYEDGHLYPHHNLYFITSETWDLRVLQAVLLSGIARLFVAAYTTRMRGDYLRFQAQHLRRIRLPCWKHVPEAIRCALRDAAGNGDTDARNKAVAMLYRLSAIECAVMFEGR